MIKRDVQQSRLELFGGHGTTSRRREFCHLITPPSTFIRRFNRDEKGSASKMTVSPTARHHPGRNVCEGAQATGGAM